MRQVWQVRINRHEAASGQFFLSILRWGLWGVGQGFYGPFSPQPPLPVVPPCNGLFQSPNWFYLSRVLHFPETITYICKIICYEKLSCLCHYSSFSKLYESFITSSSAKVFIEKRLGFQTATMASLDANTAKIGFNTDVKLDKKQIANVKIIKKYYEQHLFKKNKDKEF